jgi:hypothetical protein
LIFPYYTVRDGFQTTLTFVNTSDNFLAVKFRFMEGYNSRDVLDFNVVMSPYDVYTGVVEANGAGGARFRIPSLETTCTAPYLAPNGSFDLSPIAYTGANTDGGPTNVDRVNEGYVLAIVMGHANKADLISIRDSAAPPAGHSAALKAAATTLLSAEHANTAAECTAVQNLFDVPNFTETARLFGEPINALKGNYSLLNVPRGTAAGGTAVTLSNFFNIAAAAAGPPPVGDFVRAALPAGNGQANTACDVPYSRQYNYNGAFPNLNPLPPAPLAWAPVAGTGNGPVAAVPPPAPAIIGCPNLLTPQVFPYFLEPSLNSAYNAAPTGTATGLANNTGLLEPGYASYALSSFQAVSEALRAATVSNEWSVNPNLGVSTNWVVTHPTKAFFVDDQTHSSTTTVAVPAAGSTPRADTVQAAINRARFSSTAPAVAPDVAWLPVRPMTTAAGVVVGGGLNPFPRSFSATTATAGTSCVNVGINIWDRDELTATAGGVTPSPIQPSAQRQLCYEVNVIEFNPNNQQIFNSALAVDVSGDVSALWAQATAARPAQPFGWLRLNLGVDPAATGGVAVGVSGAVAPPAVPGTSLAGPGLPAVGFMMRERVIDTATILGNYGDAADHSYTK